MDELEALYRRHASAVFRFAWGLCGDRGQAEDIVSDTFVILLTKAPRIETQTALAFLLTIARNCFLSGCRRRKREVALPPELPAPGDGPEVHLDDRARLEMTLKALRDLPEGERAALLLRVDHGLSYLDIGAALGITAGAAKVRVHRARCRLGSALEPQGGNHAR